MTKETFIEYLDTIDNDDLDEGLVQMGNDEIGYVDIDVSYNDEGDYIDLYISSEFGSFASKGLKKYSYGQWTRTLWYSWEEL